ncbi:hypothetical protein DRH29_05340 [candidate division Kazan bacterium]|uniref:Uncharacterized protein n=1 Tax=candidate division Kazan bacterium TaxID=2202143 RepID=A0A420ZB69_UNCK3|nr:MAG: hypothetical protein DRH29_05340 [candidate division Kazan bacterium]
MIQATRLLQKKSKIKTKEVEFCKMEIRLMFFKEIVGVISLKTEVKYLHPKHLRSREEKSTRSFFLPKVSLISILQKFSKEVMPALHLAR